MTLREKDREDLVRYRLEQAKKTIAVVELLVKNNELPTAVNRIYYGIFYSLLALALKYKFETSKHQQLIGWFNNKFIRTGKIEKKYGQILRDAYKNRTKGDYDTFVKFELEEVNLMYSELIDFIKEIERIIYSEE